MEEGIDINPGTVRTAATVLNKLTGFFHLCKNDVEAHHLTYPQVVKQYCWKAASNGKAAHWAKRQRGTKNQQGHIVANTVGRIPMVPIARPEVYHLRLLLFHVHGPISYKSLCTTAEGHVLPTSQQACVYRGLIPNDAVFHELLWEIKDSMFGRHLRKLFCTLLVYHSPSSARDLWDDPEIQRCLVEDFRRQSRSRQANDAHINMALADIKDILDTMGRHIEEFGLPLPDNIAIAERIPLLIQEELDHNTHTLQLEVAAKYPSLNHEQKL
ncbi:hypothetical protein TCAL_08750, partial [Tigriopus californicus]